MALLNLDLLAGQTVVIDETTLDNDGQPISDGTVVNLNLIGAGTLVVDGVSVSVNSLVGVQLLDAPTYVAQNGGEINIDLGLLDVDLLTSLTFAPRDEGTINVTASLLALESGPINLLERGLAA